MALLDIGAHVYLDILALTVKVRIADRLSFIEFFLETLNVFVKYYEMFESHNSFNLVQFFVLFVFK